MPHKRALLIGIDEYHPAIGPLAGCVNDARQMQEILVERFAFPVGEVEELHNSSATRQAILTGLNWLIAEARAGDVLVLFYAGHGTRLPNPKDPSGKDEALVAFSPRWEALLADESDASALFLRRNWELQFIRDKEIKACLDTLRDEVNLTLVLDCCHSGDINRVPPVFSRFLDPPVSVQDAIDKALQAYWTDEQGTSNAESDGLKISKESVKHWLQKVFLGNRFDFVDTQEKNILLAACSEKETASERQFGSQRGGVFTHFFADVLRSQDAVMSHNDLMQSVGNKMRFTAQMPRLACPEEFRRWVIFSSFAAKDSHPT